MMDSLRGRVIAIWQKQGNPMWDRNQTTHWTKMADEQLEKEGKNPAPAFRRARLLNDDYYMRVFASGCRFGWLPPQPGRTRERSRATRHGTIVNTMEIEDGLVGVLARLEGWDTPMFVTQRGKPRAVLMKYEDYQTLQEKLEDMEDALAMHQALASPEEEAMSLDEYERQQVVQLHR